MEVSLNIQTEVLIEISLLEFLPFINIDDVPLLVDLTMLSMSDDVSVLVIKSTLNIQDLSFLVDNKGTLVPEELPPS